MEDQQKGKILEELFPFSNDSNFWKFLVSASKNVFDQLSIVLELRDFFVKILTHYKKHLKHAVRILSHQGYCLT